MRHSEQPDTFSLDRAGAIEAIEAVWGISAVEPAQWRLDRFGSGLGESLERLCDVVFAPARGLLRGPQVDVKVYPLSDAHHFPLLVCIAVGGGPMHCTGIEDFTAALFDPWRPSPELVCDALELLLDAAGAAYRGARWHPPAPAAEPVRSGGGRPVAPNG